MRSRPLIPSTIAAVLMFGAVSTAQGSDWADVILLHRVRR
jgi:hypothetical protein